MFTKPPRPRCLILFISEDSIKQFHRYSTKIRMNSRARTLGNNVWTGGAMGTGQISTSLSFGQQAALVYGQLSDLSPETCPPTRTRFGPTTWSIVLSISVLQLGFPHLEGWTPVHFIVGHKLNSHAPARIRGQQLPKLLQTQFLIVDLND